MKQFSIQTESPACLVEADDSEYSRLARRYIFEQDNLLIQARLMQTRWSFVFLSLFLCSQGYLLPVLPIGPSWTLWPRLCDLAWGGMLLTFPFETVRCPAVYPRMKDLYSLMAMIALIVFFGSMVTLFTPESGESRTWALHHSLRVIQFLTAFIITMKIPLDGQRVEILRKVTVFACLVSSAGVVLVYFQLLPLEWIAPMIPNNKVTAGPWFEYLRFSGRTDLHLGFGFTSYNHAYTALQIILTLGLALHLSNKRDFLSIAMICLALVGTFLSGSRAGLASLCLFVSIQLFKNPLIVLIAGLSIVSLWPVVEPLVGESLNRHEALVSGSIDDDSTNGRVSVWLDYIKYLNQEPIRWVIGCGLGSSIDIKESSPANAAHLMPLQVVAELGMLGLIVFTIVAAYILQNLWFVPDNNTTMFWCALSLLLSCASQETFYPMPAMGFFPGFFLVALAVALNSSIRTTNLNVS